jgi:glutathione peroxidase
MKKIFLVLTSISALLFARCATSQDRPKTTDNAAPIPTATAQSEFYNFKVKALDGSEFDFATLKGKKVLIVNTASKCGFTPQYAGLEKLHEQYKDKGVVVIGFPANDFMGQEPGASTEIAAFCSKNYGVTFPMMDKVTVVGGGKAPIYQWLSSKTKNGWNDQEPSWNFCKYLVNEKGELVSFFTSKVEPMSDEIVKKL